MPRRQRELTPANPFPSRALVASSVSYQGKSARIYNTNDREWQKRCYRHYRICGEARFAARFFGNALSKATLYAVNDPYTPTAPKLTEGPAVERLRELFNGSEGQAAMLAALGVHLTIAGECYLIGRNPNSGKPIDGAIVSDTDIWEIRSVLEVKSNGVAGPGGKWSIAQSGAGQADIDLTDEDVVIRIWIPDPENAGAADSPFRSVLAILDEIEWLTKYVFAQCSSRLGGAGIWLVPEEIEFPSPPDSEDHPDRDKADSLMQLLAESILKPIADPSSPAAKVPIVGTVPGEYISALKDGWITFWSELDSEAKNLRGEAIQRFALGMDLPPERVLGMSSNGGTGGGTSNGVSHWGAWQIDEDTIKMHIEPMLEVITQALTIEYLRPLTRDESAIRYDTVALRLRPDRSQESLELWDRGLLKGEIAVRENGFSIEDMPDDAEQKRWLLWKVAGGSATPDMVASALRALGVPVMQAPVELPPAMPNEARPAPSLEDHPGRDLPERAAALHAACDALVFRALERAGNRMKRVYRESGAEMPSCRSYEVHTLTPAPSNAAKKLLDDAWSCADTVIEGTGHDPEKVIPLLDGYVTSLLTTGQQHSRQTMAKWLDRA